MIQHYQGTNLNEELPTKGNTPLVKASLTDIMHAISSTEPAAASGDQK